MGKHSPPGICPARIAVAFDRMASRWARLPTTTGEFPRDGTLYYLFSVQRVDPRSRLGAPALSLAAGEYQYKGPDHAVRSLRLTIYLFRPPSARTSGLRAMYVT